MWLGFLQPGVRLGEDSQTALLPRRMALVVVAVLVVALKAVELVNEVRGHVGAPGFALELHLLRFNEFAQGMGQQARRLDAVLRGHGVVAVEQTQRCLLRTAGGVV